QIVKAFLYKAKYRETLSDSSMIENLRELDAEIQTVEAPLLQLLYSVRGTMLFDYYQSMRWSLMRRTATADFTPEDITTWGLENFREEIRNSYLLSIAPKSGTEKISIEDYRAILTGAIEYENERPTLYDFLAYRALEFFSPHY